MASQAARPKSQAGGGPLVRRDWQRCGSGSTLLLLDDLTDADEVSIRIDDSKLSKSPRLVFKSVHARDVELTRFGGRVLV